MFILLVLIIVLFPFATMKKNNQNTKLPSFRTTIEKRISANQNLLTSSKPQFGQEITNEQVLQSGQSQIAKRIQSKIRLRKATGSQKQYSRQACEQINTVQKIVFQNNDSNDFAAKIEQLWDSCSTIKSILSNYLSIISPAQVKKRIIKQSGILKCQSANHDVQELLALRVKKLCELMASEKRCFDNELLLGRLLDDRMRKLTDVLRTR